MGRTILGIVMMLFMCTSLSFGQNYSVVYDSSNEDVQFKMDSNKILGLDILSGVAAAHTVGVAGLNTNQKEQLISVLQADARVTEVTIEDLNVIIIQSAANLYKADVELVLSDFNVTITNHAVIYSLID